MHPAPSLIAFSVLSGLGLGLLAMLGLGLIVPTGWAAFLWFGLGYALTLCGLGASALHLRHPERALKAFTQWRTSWLSREAVLALAALLLIAPHAAGSVFLARPMPALGLVAALMALLTVLATAMIYAQLRTVPRWHHWSVPVLFLLAAFAGGLLLIGSTTLAPLALALLAVALLAHWMIGDQRFAGAGHTGETATGLGPLGQVRQLEPPHTGTNYLLREMAHVVARRHAIKLRVLALVCAAVLPMLLLVLTPVGQPVSPPVWALAVALHVLGMLAARWLFFAEAEHVMGLYYGRH
ncbi:DmsC/YnfH family molybdoenzyme membrane anchor subunit [Pararhodobacter sp. SW119]|uniref:dimethyl sulfoxide reductase anchor subunit family protein n=1 Tax=Pararhodobacter sp. SW119 TaxID=2780075 RepID=UPI001AE07ED4|nr:DmsC/YnfH family molybdoenzyme membrane anchor subunit [Pararhodobacter sp. SW119]